MKKLLKKLPKKAYLFTLLGLAIIITFSVLQTGGGIQQIKPELPEEEYISPTAEDGDTDIADEIDIVPVIEPVPTSNHTAEPDAVLNVEGNEHISVNLTEIKEVSTPPPEPTAKPKPTSKPKKPKATPKPTPKPNPKTESKPAAPKKPANNQPANGAKNNGKVYIEGFGWIKDNGGGSQGGSFGKKGEKFSDKQVGSMG